MTAAAARDIIAAGTPEKGAGGATMPRTKKGAEKPAKRSKAQRAADAAYSEKNKENQRENFGNIGATCPKAEKNAIKAAYTAHGITPAQVMRAAWHRLINGEDSSERIREDAEKARAEYAAMTATTDENQNHNA